MRYIHDGKVRNPTVEPPKRFVFHETNLFRSHLSKLRKTKRRPLAIGHEPDRWKWTDE